MALRVNTPSCIHSTHPHLLPYMPQPSPIVPVSVDRSRTSPLALRSPPGIANSQTRRSLKRNRDDGHHTTTTEAKSLNESEPHDSTRQPPHGATREPPRKAHAPTHATKQWTWFRNLSRHQMAHIGSAQVDWANKVGHIRAMKWRQFIADEESVALINRLYQQYRAFTDPTPETNDSACTTEAGSHTRASMPSEHDTQLANETRPLLPAPASATMAASTAATSLGDDKGFCQLWLAIARQELQLPASWAVQISESWNRVSTDLNAVTEPTPSGNSHHTTVRCRRRHDPTDRVDLLPTAKRVYSQFIFHASKLLLLHRNQYGLQSVRRKGRHDPLKNNYYEKNYNSEALFKNHLAKAFKGFFDRADNRNSKSCLWAEWKLTEAGEALSPLSPDQLATLQSILSDLPVDQSMATTNLATASEPGVAFLALARVAAETSRAITRNTRQGQAAQGSTLDTRATKRVHFQPAARAEHIGEPIQTEMSNPDPGPASVPELGPSPGSRRARAPEPRSRQRKRGPGNTLRLTHPPGINLDARLTTLHDTAYDYHNDSIDFEISASAANNVPNSNASTSDSEQSDSSTGSISTTHIPRAAKISPKATTQAASHSTSNQVGGCANTHAEQTLQIFRQKYKQTHAAAMEEIKDGHKRTCWSWWIWPTNYRPGASVSSRTWALTDELAAAFVTDAFLRNHWILIMSAVATQLENGVSVHRLCGTDAPRVRATCDLFSRVAQERLHFEMHSLTNDKDVQEVCQRVYKALGNRDPTPALEPHGDDDMCNADVYLASLHSPRSDSSSGSDSGSDHDEPSDIADVAETASFPRDMQHVPSLHTLLQPVDEKDRPTPSKYENPEEWRTSPPFVAGGLHLPDGATASAKWSKRIGPSLSNMVGNWVEHGYQIRPRTFRNIDVPNRSLHKIGQHTQDIEIESAIRSKVVREFNPNEIPHGFVSWTHCISQVPKKHTSETRTVYEMVEGNKDLKSWRVRHEGPRQVRHVAQPNDFAAMVDLRKGYWQVKCGPPWLLLLRARIKRSWLKRKPTTTTNSAENKHDEPWTDALLAWRVLVMGMKLAGAVFQKVVKQLLGRWRRLGFRLVNILDDTLFLDQSAQRMRDVILPTVVDDCQHLHVQINYEKSTLVPVQRVEWHGILWCFDTGTAHIPSEKIDRTITLMTDISQHPEDFTPRAAARVAGTLMAMSPAISCSKCMTIDCYKATRKPARDSPRRSHWDTNIALPIQVQQELTFWLKFLLALNQHGRNIFASNRQPDLRIRGDGSRGGYGGTTTDSQGHQRALIFDKWSNAELALLNGNQYLAELLTLIKLVQANLTGQALEWSNTTIQTHLANPFTANQLSQAMQRPSTSQGFHTLHFEGDNEAVMYRINNAKGKNEVAGQLAKLLLYTLMASGSTLSISTVGGQAMIDCGVDAASRRTWAHPSTWNMSEAHRQEVVAWTLRQFKQPHTRVVSAMPSSSTNPLRELTAPIYRRDEILICIPQPSMINNVAAFLNEFKLQGTLVLPAWPSMALPLILQHTTAAKRIGTANAVFDSTVGDIPSWPYAMFAFNFNAKPTYARLHSDWSYINAVYFPGPSAAGPAQTTPPDLSTLARPPTDVAVQPATSIQPTAKRQRRGDIPTTAPPQTSARAAQDNTSNSNLLGSLRYMTIHENVEADAPPCFLRNGWKSMNSVDKSITTQLQESTQHIARGIEKHQLQQKLQTQRQLLKRAEEAQLERVNKRPQASTRNETRTSLPAPAHSARRPHGGQNDANDRKHAFNSNADGPAQQRGTHSAMAADNFPLVDNDRVEQSERGQDNSATGPPLPPPLAWWAKTSPNIITVANVGGPCGGKSSGLPVVAAHLRRLGWTVVICPETATSIFLAASEDMPDLATPDACNVHYNITRLQTIMLHMQIQMEDRLKEVLDLCYQEAPASHGAILLCDRGSLCGKAFCSPHQWDLTLQSSKAHEHDLLKRYDLVIQWQSVAVDLVHRYQFGAGSNNEQRRHNAAQAATSDARSLDAWVAHPHLALITNSCDFQDKCVTATRIIAAHGWHLRAAHKQPTDPWSAAHCTGHAAAMRAHLQSKNVIWHPTAWNRAPQSPITLFITISASNPQPPTWFAVSVPNLHTPIGAVATKISQRMHIPKYNILLMYEGRYLPHKHKLKTYGLQNGSTIGLEITSDRLNRPTGGKNETNDRKHPDNTNADGPPQNNVPTNAAQAPWTPTSQTTRRASAGQTSAPGATTHRAAPWLDWSATPTTPQATRVAVQHRRAPWSGYTAPRPPTTTTAPTNILSTPTATTTYSPHRATPRPHHNPSSNTTSPPQRTAQININFKRPQWWALLPNPSSTTWISARKRSHCVMDRGTLERRADTLLTSSLEESTRRNYLSWWHRFTTFCCDPNIGWSSDTTEIPLPVDTVIFRLYIAYLAPCYAASTIENALAAVAAVCRSHGQPGPATDPGVYKTLEGAKRMGPVTLQSNEIVEPDHIRKILLLQRVQGWSHLRLLRAKAMIVWTFVIILRHCETRQMDLCDISQVDDGSIARVRKAKNDAIGRGASTMFGHGTPWAAKAEKSLYDWIEEARLKPSAQCTKKLDPRAHCTSCGFLFRRLRTSKQASAVTVTDLPISHSTLTQELRLVYCQLVKDGQLPPTFDTKRRAIDLRRGGHTAMANKDVKSLRRAAHGRWKNPATCGDNYTFLHRSLMMQHSSIMLD